MVRFLCCFHTVDFQAGKEKWRRGLLECGICLLMLLTLVAGRADIPQAQPVFFSMLFPQLIPKVEADCAQMKGEPMEALWDMLFGKAVWL